MSQLQEKQAHHEWNEICQWLRSLNYISYASAFKNAGYDLWEIVIDLTIDDLMSIGIKPGHARRIEKQLSVKKSQIINLQKRIHNANVTHAPLTKTKPIVNINTNTNACSNRLQQIEFVEKIQNQLFQATKCVINGLQQQLIEMNTKFSKPILSLQSVLMVEKSKSNTAHMMDDSSLLNSLCHIMNELKVTHDTLWNRVTQLRNIAESQINNAAQQIHNQTQAFKQAKRSNNRNNMYDTPSVLNTVIANLDPIRINAPHVIHTPHVRTTNQRNNANNMNTINLQSTSGYRMQSTPHVNIAPLKATNAFDINACVYNNGTDNPLKRKSMNASIKLCEELLRRTQQHQQTNSNEPKRKKAKVNPNFVSVLPLRQ
eukprot:179437_1